MIDRLLSFVGACGLLLAVTASMPIATAYAVNSEDCNGGCDKGPDGKKCSDPEAGTCFDTSGCGCVYNSISGAACHCGISST